MTNSDSPSPSTASRDPAGCRLRQAYERLRGRRFETFHPPTFSVVTPLVYRTCARVGLAGSHDYWIDTGSSRDLWDALEDVHAASRRDASRWWSEHAFPVDEATLSASRRQVERIQHLAPLSPLYTRITPTERDSRVIFDLDSAAVLVPWTGIALEELPHAKAIAAAYRGVRATDKPLPSRQDSVRLVNAFPRHHNIAQGFRALTAMLPRAELVEATTVDRLREEIRTRSSVLVVGAHGNERRMLQPFAFQLEGQHEPLEKVFGGVELPAASTVVCFTCFGGGGQLRAGGEWDGLPGRFLEAGHVWSSPAGGRPG